MNCGKCDAQLADDAKFCPHCGARVDGKKVCPGCGREIAEDAVYCTYCGKRQDGKVVCNKCGEVYEGNFCPKCGTAVRPQAAIPGYSPAPAAMNALAAPALFLGILSAIGMMADGEQVAAVNTILVDSAVVFALYVVVFALTAVAMVAFAKGIVKRNGSCRTAACVFSGISFGVSIAYLVMSIVLCDDSATPAKIGASPICALIFTVFTLAMAIVNACLLRKKNDAPVYEEYTG